MNRTLNEWQADVNVSIETYNNHIQAENKNISNRNKELSEDIVITSYSDWGKPIYDRMDVPEKLHEPLEQVTIVEVKKMPDNGLQLILDSGDRVCVGFGDPVAFTEPQEINNDSRSDIERWEARAEDNRVIDIGIEAMGRCVEFYKIEGKRILSDPSVEAICRMARAFKKKTPEEQERYDLAVERIDFLLNNDIKIFFDAFQNLQSPRGHRIREDYQTRFGSEALQTILKQENQQSTLTENPYA